MMLRIIHTCLLLCVALLTAAQTPAIFLLSGDTAWRSKNMMALVGGQGVIGSNALDVEFMKKSLLGGHLDRDHLDQLADGMPLRARAGYDGFGQLELLNFRDTLFGNPNLGLRASVGSYYHGNIGFSPEAFRTVYLGNSNHSSQSVAMGPLSYQNQAWQKFGFGLFNKKTLSGFTVSLVEGQRFQQLVADAADLYTSPLGDSLSLAVEGDFFRSDTARMGWANGSGIGASIDFDYNLLLPQSKGVVSVSVRNLGFVVWNEASEHYEVNSSIDWNGLNVNNWIDGTEDTLSLPNWQDSLNNGRTQTSFARPLPASIAFRYMKQWKGKHFWETGFTLFPNRVAVPQVYAGLVHALTNRLWISERISYGGYSEFSLGVEVNWLSKNSWFVKAGTSQLEGWLLPMAGGRSVYMNLGKNF